MSVDSWGSKPSCSQSKALYLHSICSVGLENTMFVRLAHSFTVPYLLHVIVTKVKEMAGDPCHSLFSYSFHG